MQSTATTWNECASSGPSLFQVRDRAIDLRVLADLIRVDMALAAALYEAGWTVTKLGALNGVAANVVDAIVLGLEVISPDLKVKVVCEKVVCDKDGFERWCVTQLCVKMGVKDGMRKMVCDKVVCEDGVRHGCV